jgi:hypothetical protein
VIGAILNSFTLICLTEPIAKCVIDKERSFYAFKEGEMPKTITDVCEADVSTPPAIIAYGNPAYIAREVKAQVNVVQDVMRHVMKEKEHYGDIPYCGEKKVLLKSGAEKLMLAFRLGAEPIIETQEKADGVSYRVRVRLFRIGNHAETVGWGLGEASSYEEKWAWKKAVCDEEYNAADESARRIKYFSNGSTAKQVRINYRDNANTVLKMAYKRALVSAVLTATAASDIFSQDLEEWDEEALAQLAKEKGKGAPVIPPEVKAATAEQIKSALSQLGLTYKEKDGWIAVEGDTYKHKEAIKALGFDFNAKRKLYLRKLPTSSAEAL